MDPIAIVGLGCLFPGAESPDEFWANLISGRDTTSLATAADMGFDPELLHDPAHEQPDRYWTLRGGFVRGFRFDPWGLQVAASRLDGLDPMFEWAVHVARAALADAGYLTRADVLRRCGIVLGNLSFPTRTSYSRLGRIYSRSVEAGLTTRLAREVSGIEHPGGPAGQSTENLRFVSQPAAVTAEALGLGGPHLVIDAACASSLYAVRLACDRLRSGEADLMLAGAVSAADPLFVHMGFSIFRAYPDRDGDSLPLDTRSRGLLSGQGAGVVALRRYADAVRDGDRIAAVIRGIGLSNDGAGRHLLVPNPHGQRLALERAYEDAGLAPSSIDYVECHATGTPLGDATELDALEALFEADGARRPLIGSVKSNFGHLLTAAGIASIIKTTLAIERGAIPPTIGVDRPLASSRGTVGGAGVVREPTAWPDRAPGAPRRAAVSAFGFGGTNAHLILQQVGGPGSGAAAPRRPARPAAGRPPTELAIVGMGARFGPLADIGELDRALYYGQPVRHPPPPGRWNGVERYPDLLAACGLADGPPAGAYLDSFELDFLRARVPPEAGDRPTPQQLLLFDVADRAVRDSGLRRGARVAVIVAVEAELALHRYRGRVDLDWQLPALLDRLGVELPAPEREALIEVAKDAIHEPAYVNRYVSFIGNIIASRVASSWDFSGPALTVSAGEVSVFRALEVARDLLASGEVEAAVVGAVDLVGGLEAVAARAWSVPQREVHVGEGAGAIVVRRASDCVEEAAPIYAVLEGLALTTPAAGDMAGREAAIALAAGQALAGARVPPTAIGYLEVSGACGWDATELRGLAEVFRTAAPHDGGQASCAVGSAAHVLGEAGAASGIVALIHAALSLAGRHLPGSPELPYLGREDPWSDTLWYLAERARPWLAPDRAERRAAISGIGADGTAAHAVLREGTPPAPLASRLHARSPQRLVALCAGDAGALLRELGILATALETTDGPSLDEIAAARIDALERDAELPLRVVLVGATAGEIAHQARLALVGVPVALASASRWETPAGSCFVARALGHLPGAVAFVYPGAFSAYPGLGGDLLQLFPALHDRLAQRASDPAEITGERRLRPRARRLPDDDALAAATVALRQDAVSMIQVGMSHALMTTAVLRDWFAVAPAAAFGYSMGEASMLWALGVWSAGDEASRRLHASPLFRTQLVGPCAAVAARVPGAWTSVVVAATLAQVERAVAQEARVWITHVHTAREVVLGGAAEDVARVVAALGADSFAAPVRAAIHCEAMADAHAALLALHRLPVAAEPPVRFYSAADYAPTPIESERLARNIATATCQPIDFPRLVERAWEDGARVFVEMGPGTACTRWIGEILHEREHAALSVDGRGVDDATALVRALARLVAERVPVRLDALRDGVASAQAPQRSALARVSVCGQDLVPFGGRGDPEARPVLDEAALLAFAGGRVADAFGAEYAPLDSLLRRVRLPLPPYLLVSRVTALSGRRGVFEPSSVTTEYDIPKGAWYSVDGQAPMAIAIEAGQCDLLLISYLGVDFEYQGARVYRLLDCTLTFLDALPAEGSTLRYEIRIDSFTRMGETLLFFFAYDCYVGDRRILEMRGGCAGFFTDAELADGRGVVDSREYLAARAQPRSTSFAAPLRCERRSFDVEDLRRLAAGDLASCFGDAHGANGRNPSLRLPPEPMRMLDRVVAVDPHGGAWGLGLLEAEKDLAPEDWYFPCHFQGDQVLAGSLMAEGCTQLLQVYLLFLGLHAQTTDARFQPVAGTSQRVICRGQVTPAARQLCYRMEIKAIDGGARPAARADCDILVDGRTVVRFTDLAIELAEKAPVAAAALYDEDCVREFTIGSVAACFGPEFLRFDERRVPRSPNGDLQLITRVLDASPRDNGPQPGAWLVSEYDVPDDPWFTRASAYPATPYSILMEIALQPCGFLSAHQGTSFIYPDADLYFRNLDGSGHLRNEVDLRGKTVRVRVALVSTTALSGVILQKFTYEVACESETVFDGDALFGYFEPPALAQQAGLDGGRREPPWLAAAGLAPQWLELRDGSPLARASPARPHERLAASKLRLLDRVAVVPAGGRHGLGYVIGEKRVDPGDWFFACHFHLDPVMPGSLGVEAIVEALHCLALRTGLTRGFQSPRFGQRPGVCTSWKYRGQIVQSTRTMTVEAHLSAVAERDGVLVALAEASLWRDGLRIYEVRDLSLCIGEAATAVEPTRHGVVEAIAG